jgi:hypothetical protein
MLTGHGESLVHQQPLRIAGTKISGKSGSNGSITDLLKLFSE